MLTILDLEALTLEAEALANDYEAEFQRLFMAPVVRMQAALDELAKESTGGHGDAE